MSTKLSSEESKKLVGVHAFLLDSVDLHFLKTSQRITVGDFSNLIKSMIDQKKYNEFSGICEFGPVEIGILQFSNRYFECFKRTELFPYEGSIIFYAEANLVNYKRRIVWPLLSDFIYTVNPQICVCASKFKLPYKQTVELDSKTRTINLKGAPLTQKISFSRVYQFGKRILWTFATDSVIAISDLVIHEKQYRYSDSKRLPVEYYSTKTLIQEPLWLIRHQEDDKFLDPEEE